MVDIRDEMSTWGSRSQAPGKTAYPSIAAGEHPFYQIEEGGGDF